ncbi:MAG: tetratricopeptide repeat protein [Leptolyngbya sp. SIO1E4]|nr:tetratricopeptide repeat protein [Leptolyngbya sp. SIO1E4]
MKTCWTALLEPRWLAAACLASWGWLGMPLSVMQPAAQAQTSQMCVDEIGFHLQGVVVERANRGREALQAGDAQQAAQYLTSALDFLDTIEIERVRVQLLESFIISNSIDAGWLVTDVDRLIEMGETDAVRMVLAPARVATERLSGGYSFLKTTLLTTIAADYGAIGDHAIARELLDQARGAEANVQGAEFKAKALTAIAQGYVAAGDLEMAADVATLALQLAESVTYPNPVRRTWVMEPIASVYVEAGEIEQALQLTTSLEPYYRDSVTGRVALAMARAGQWRQATDLLATLSLREPKIQTLIALGIQQTQAGDAAQGQRLFEQAIATITAEEFLPVDVASTLIQADFPEIALEALIALPDGAFLKVPGLIELARHYGELGEPERVGDVLQQALSATVAIEEDYRRNDLLQQLFEQMIETEAYPLAIATIESLPETSGRFDQMTAYEKVASAAAQSGQLEVAVNAAEAIDPSFISVRNQAWGAIARAYATAGDFDAALAVAQKIDRRDSPDYAQALASIGVQYHKAGLLEASTATMTEALKAATALETPTVRVRALNDLALTYAKAGQTDAAIAVFEQVLERAIAVPPASSTPSPLQAVANSWIEIGESEFALRAIQAITDEQRQEASLQTLVDYFIAEGQYAQALENIDAYHVPANQAHQRLRVAELYFQAGQTASALPVLARAFEAAQAVPGEESQVIQVREDLVADELLDRGSLYEEIAIAYGKMGAFEQGMAVAQSLQGSEMRDRVMERLRCYRDL